MDKNEHTTTTIPAHTSALTVKMASLSVNPHTTQGTFQSDFESVKHLFSDKPLQRPSRTRPLS